MIFLFFLYVLIRISRWEQKMLCNLNHYFHTLQKKHWLNVWHQIEPPSCYSVPCCFPLQQPLSSFLGKSIAVSCSFCAYDCSLLVFNNKRKVEKTLLSKRRTVKTLRCTPDCVLMMWQNYYQKNNCNFVIRYFDKAVTAVIKGDSMW